MSARSAHAASGSHEELLKYDGLSLVDLIRRIVEADDGLALREFHDGRTPFAYGERRSMRLVEYVDALRERSYRSSWAGFSSAVCDQAYDLTIDKFSRLPSDEVERQDVKRDGPDCRYYFAAFLKRVSDVLGAQTVSDAIETEVKVARILQRMVTRHFQLSCLECHRRSKRLVSRYFWKVGEGIMCLWLPSYMERRAKRAWLERAVKDPDPRRPGERERIQSIIDRQLPAPKAVPLDQCILADCDASAGNDGEPWSVVEAVSVHGLAEAVAQEKANNIECQRRSIRALGARSLKKMIVEIFGGLSRGDLDDGEMARRFGLSKATFSRFAGSRWSQAAGVTVPDLWVNTAQTLAGHPVFVEAAQEAGVWQRVGDVLTGTHAGRRSVDDD